MKKNNSPELSQINWFRNAAPYINAHRGAPS
jgi:amino-acid N-acetyltransferase